MYLKSLPYNKIKQINNLLPQLDFLSSTSRVVNYLTMDLNKNSEQWQHRPQNLHDQHMLAQAYLQLHFKNHIMDFMGLGRLQAIMANLQQTENEDVMTAFLGDNIAKNSSKDERKCLYIMLRQGQFDARQFMGMHIMNHKNINKILCFENAHPIGVSERFQQFCRYVLIFNKLTQNSIKALGLSNFTTKSLIKQVMKHSKSSILIHQTVLDSQQSIYAKTEDYTNNSATTDNKNSGLKYTVNDILLFCNWVDHLDYKIKTSNLFSSEQLLKNYSIRRFPSKTQAQNFGIKRFQRLDDTVKHSQFIARQQGQVDSQDQDE